MAQLGGGGGGAFLCELRAIFFVSSQFIILIMGRVATKPDFGVSDKVIFKLDAQL